MNDIATDIETFVEVVVETNPCDLTFVRKKDKQAQMMAADLDFDSVDNIQVNLKRKIHTQRRESTRCCFLPAGRMVFTCYGEHYLSFINSKGVEPFQIGSDKAESCTFDTVYIEEDNNIAVSSVR